LHSVARSQIVARCGQGFDYRDVGGCCAALDQAADDGTGHLAAAYECNGLGHGVWKYFALSASV
jgi:hypothetical protein